MMWVEKCDNRAVGRMRVRRRDTRIWFITGAVFLAVFLFTFLRQSFNNTDEVEAANLENFDPGYIISDYQMSRYNAMTEEEIQAFLTSKNPCNNTSQSSYEYLTERYPNLKWHFENGHFVCLSEELFGDGEVIGEGETAAHIIWQAAQDYQINPQVLIVLLQKEQGLITDTYPNSRQYRAATGYGCPDTAACSEKYYGFKNQVRNAAGMFRAVLNGGWTNYPLGDNYIQYNPNKDCGGSVVNVRSLATSALYRYTPYQPNEGALAAGYGTAYCGSYGNRNFYHYFEDWFSGIVDEEVQAEVVENNTVEISTDSLLVIHSAANPNKVVEITGGVGAAKKGTNIQLYEYNNTDAQKWKAIHNDDGTYTFINLNTAMVLDVENGVLSDGSNIQLYNPNGTCAQKWKLDYNDDGTYTIITACANMVMGADGKDENLKNGANIGISSFGRSAINKWVLEKLDVPVGVESFNVGASVESESTYVIASSLDENMVIDISGGTKGSRNGTNIQLYRRNNTDAQNWKIIKNDDGTVTIVNPTTQKALDVNNGVLKDWTNIQLYTQNGTCAQKWVIEEDEDNTMIFRSACANVALDVANGSTKNGANVQIYKSNGTLAQKWVLKRVSEKISTDSLLVIHSAANPNKVVEITGGVGAAKKGTNIQLYEYNNTDAQKWKAIHNDDGTYTFINLNTAMVLDVENGVLSDGSNIQLYNPNGTCAQKWKLDYNDDGTYTIITACANMVMGADGKDENTNGGNVYIIKKSGDTSQKWIVELFGR